MLEMFGFEISPAMIWLAAGFALLLLEVSTGTLWLLWPGLGALVFAAIAAVAPDLSLGVQLLGFAALSGLLTLAGQKYLEERVKNRRTDRPNLNNRAAQLIGRRGAAAGPFENGYGAVKLDDGQWGARLESGEGADIQEGDSLEIKAVEGSVLVVARV